MKNQSGKAGEEHIARWLESQGYEILARNFHSRYGEIDIVAQRPPYIAFVEVKARVENSLVSPFEAITPRKQRKIIATAQEYLRQHPGVSNKSYIAGGHRGGAGVFGKRLLGLMMERRRAMRYFDLHCDTMTECAVKDIPLRENTLHVSLEQVKDWEHYVQCYAVWLPDDLRGEAAWQRFLQVAERFAREVGENAGSLEQLRGAGDLDRLERQGRHGAILTVERGAVLGGKLERVQECKRLGVGMCTLTWNGATELGRGVMAPGRTGLTKFGRQAVKAMEEAGILIDISHASPELFWDVAEIAVKPLVGSHSNAKAVYGHPRHLERAQFEAIRDSGGLVGLNFYTAFLNDKPERASMEDVLRHAEYFLALGGEDTLAMGGDWDGAELPPDMPGLSAIPALYELFLRHYPEPVVEKLFYGNAARLFRQENLL